MACECIALTNKALADENLMLDVAHWTNLQTGAIRTTVRIGTEKVKPKRGQRCPSFVPKFCPFCGVAYEQDGK
jgi:hypothetical protein